jgi:hypothetical protein
MTTLHSMNHQQAIDSMAVERYVLGEMTATDRQAFEEHYFSCPECLEAITYASDFLEVGREYVQENAKTQPAPVPVPTPTWYNRIFSASWWFSPVPAFVSAVFLVLLGFSTYQGIELGQVKKSLRSPSVITASVFVPPTARAGSDARGVDLPLVAVDRNQAFALDLDLPPHDQYSSYEGEIISASGSAGIPVFALPAEQLNQASRVQLAIPPTLPEGTYQFIIQGTNHEAKGKTTIARYDFVLKFKS